MSDSRHAAILPFEILAHILADADFRTLKTCSLASRAFLLATRPYMFEKATINLHPYSTSVSSTKNHPLTNFLQFLVCDSEENHVASFISALCFVYNAPSSSSSVEHLASHRSEVAERLTQLLPKLTRLRHLVIKSAFFSDWTLDHNGLRQVLFKFMQINTVHHVELDYVGLSRGELLFLTRIREVTLVGVYETSKHISNDAIPSAQVKAPLLLNLAITVQSLEGARYMFQLANAAKTSLISLRWLTSSYMISQDPYFQEIAVTELSYLNHLAIALPMNKLSLAKLSDLLGAYPAGHLQVLELVCDCEGSLNENTISTWCWQSFNAVLSRMTEISLKCVKVRCKQPIIPKNRKTLVESDKSSKVLAVFRKHCLPVIGLQVEG